MVRNKTPLFVQNLAPCMYVPTVPTDNPAFQNTEVDNLHYNGVTIEQMRDAPELFSSKLSGLDKLSSVQAAMNANVPDVKKASKQFSEIKKALRK